MKDIQEVLKRKEQLVHEKQMELQHLEKEIEALRAVLPMLRDDAEQATGGAVARAGSGASTKAISQEPTSRWP